MKHEGATRVRIVDALRRIAADESMDDPVDVMNTPERAGERIDQVATTP